MTKAAKKRERVLPVRTGSRIYAITCQGHMRLREGRRTKLGGKDDA